jgi:Ca-activated chloride channel homolog
MQTTQAQPRAEANQPLFRLTPKSLGIGLFLILAVLTPAPPGRSRIPKGGPQTPLAALAPKANPALPAPAPVALSRVAGSKVGFGVTLDRSAVVQGGDGLARLELVMKADDVNDAARAETDFVVVLDHSGSMSGDRIEKAKNAVLALIDQLSEGDRLGLVIFDNRSERLIQLARAVPSTKEQWRRLVQGIEPENGTNLSEGLADGFALLASEPRSGRAGRLLLLSDGEANAGDTSPEGLRSRAQRVAQSERTLSTIGIGEGFNEYVMAQIADAGTGNFHYLADSGKLGGIIERELQSTRATVASGLRVRFDGTQVVDAGGYPLERGWNSVTFSPGSLFSGQERRVWVTVRVPTDQIKSVKLDGVALSYVEAGQGRTVSPAEPLAIACIKDEKAALASLDKGAWERGVVQEEWGRVQQDVARAVREGKRAEALGWLTEYRAKQAALNQSVGSLAVDGTLAESRALERQVSQAFEGVDQADKQNLFSKRNLAQSRAKRRIGSISASDAGEY